MQVEHALRRLFPARMAAADTAREIVSLIRRSERTRWLRLSDGQQAALDLLARRMLPTRYGTFEREGRRKTELLGHAYSLHASARMRLVSKEGFAKLPDGTFIDGFMPEYGTINGTQSGRWTGTLEFHMLDRIPLFAEQFLNMIGESGAQCALYDEGRRAMLTYRTDGQGMFFTDQIRHLATFRGKELYVCNRMQRYVSPQAVDLYLQD